jgi:hypothetical protein
MDCFIDGFLIGVTCTLAPKAGIVLGAANCLEMAFLGMAYATRIVKCTGSSFSARTITLYSPPMLMFIASGFGAYVADASSSIPALYVAFVAFGVVALLALVCNEQLIYIYIYVCIYRNINIYKYMYIYVYRYAMNC